MNNGYSICLNEWALDKEIKNELGLLLIISSLTAEKGYCFANNTYFAELFDIDEISVSRKIKKLEEKGYITIDYKKRGCEVISREIRLTKMLTDDYQNCKSTINKNVKDNNIIINNNNNNELLLLGNYNISYNWNDNIECECITKEGIKCSKRSSFIINGKNHCNQHAKFKLGKFFNYLDQNDNNKLLSKKVSKKLTNLELFEKLYSKEEYIHIKPETKLFSSIKDWLEYKQERKDTYTEIGLKKLLTQINTQTAKYGDGNLIEVIDSSIASGYKGITFDKLIGKQPKVERRYFN